MVRTIEQWLARPGGLAERLRELRHTTGMTGTELASRLGWTQSKVSKLETGKQMPADADIARWTDACQASPEATAELAGLLAEAQGVHREWRHQIRLGQERIQRNYDDLARQARTIRNAEIVYVPGLLQTPEYARCRIAESVDLHGASADEIDQALAERLQRQQILYETSKRFEFVITEAALHLLLCPPEAMLAQLDRLLGLTSGLPHISFGIIPFGVPLVTTPQNGFILFESNCQDLWMRDLDYAALAAATASA